MLRMMGSKIRAMWSVTLLSPGGRRPNLRFRKNSAYRMEMGQRFQDTEDKETREKAGAVTSKEIEVNQCGIIKRT